MLRFKVKRKEAGVEGAGIEGTAFHIKPQRINRRDCKYPLRLGDLTCSRITAAVAHCSWTASHTAVAVGKPVHDCRLLNL